MIRDRLVVGIRDARLSEKLQLDSELTLEKAVTQVRQAEAIKLQQPLLRGGGSQKPDTQVGTVQEGSGRKARQLSKSSRSRGGMAHKQPSGNKVCS